MRPFAAPILSFHHGGSPYVFPGWGGRQRTDINKHVNQIKQKAGLPKDFRPLHGLCHAYASILASSGQVDLYTLQKLLTHKSPLITQRYAHLRDEALMGAPNLAGNLIEKPIEDTKTKRKRTRRNTRRLARPEKISGSSTEWTSSFIFLGLAFQRKAKKDRVPAWQHAPHPEVLSASRGAQKP